MQTQKTSLHLTRDQITSRIRPRLLSSEYHSIENLVKQHLSADIWLTWYIDLKGILDGSLGEGHPLTAVTYSLAEYYNLSIDDLLRYGNENSSGDFYLRPMNAVLNDLCDTDIPAPDHCAQLMIVSNSTYMFGATAILDAGVQRQIKETFPDGYYCLPSSIHEFLIADQNALHPDQLAEMVQSINRSNVFSDPRDILSDHVYTITDDGSLTVVA